jgi:hypothetical protein
MSEKNFLHRIAFRRRGASVPKTHPSRGRKASIRLEFFQSDGGVKRAVLFQN